MFNINFFHLLYNIMPWFLRGPRHLEWLKSIIKPLQELNNKTVYSLQWNSQIASFETFLNSEYSLPYLLENRAALIASTSIIWIEDTAVVNETYLFNTAENQPPTYLFNNSEAGGSDVILWNNNDTPMLTDFIVWVPSTLSFSLNQLKAQINQYRIASKRYQIQTY